MEFENWTFWNLKLWKGQKLRRMVLLHGEQLTFHFPKKQKVFVFMIFGSSRDVHDPQKQLFLTLDTPNHWNTLWNLNILNIEKFKVSGTDACRQILEVRLMGFWKYWTWDPRKYWHFLKIWFSYLIIWNSQNIARSVYPFPNSRSLKFWN